MGGGFGRLGAGAGGGAAGSDVIPGEANGLGVNFTHAVDAQRVCVRTAGVDVFSGLDTFFQNGGTTPKLVTNASGLLEWSPHNLFLNSATPATQSVTTIVGAPYTVTVTGTGSLTGSAGAAGVATSASPLTYVATTTTSTFTLAGSLTTIQINIGRSATAYVATTAARRFGLAIDVDPVVGRTLLMEGSVTNICLYSSDMTQTAWVKTTMTAALTATDPMGNANSATTLTATAGNATALQAITSTSALRITSVYLKSRLGAPTVDLTQDNGSTWTTTPITTSWARYAVPEVTSANPTIGIRIVSMNSQVDVAFWQHEVSTIARVATSPYPTFAVSQGRIADNYTFLLSTIPALGSEYSMYCRFAVPNPTVNAVAPMALTDGTANEQSKFLTATATTMRLNVIDGGVVQALIVGGAVSANSLYSAAGRVKLNDCALSTNGAAVVIDNTATLPTVTEVRFGGSGANTAASNVMRIAKLGIVPRAWSDAELLAASVRT